VTTVAAAKKCLVEEVVKRYVSVGVEGTRRERMAKLSQEKTPGGLDRIGFIEASAVG
jgi:hypothetical protein